MSGYVKQLMEKELGARFAGVSDFLVMEIKGLNGIDNNQMRGALKKKGMGLTVVKNSTMRRTLDVLGRGAAASLFLAGPCTVAYGGDNVVDLAKEMMEWTKKFKVLRVKGAFVEGQVLDTDGATALAKMPTRIELQGRLVRMALTPGSKVAGALRGPGARIAGCIKSIIEKLEKEQPQAA